MKHFLRPYTKTWFLVPGIVLLAGSMATGTYGQSLQAGGMWQGNPLLLLHNHAQSYLGVDVVDVDQERAQALHLREGHGAEITVLDHDAPAGKVGLKLHDVIVQMNGETIEGAEHVKRILRETAPGHKVEMVVSRDGVMQTLNVQLTDRKKVEEEARQQLGSLGGSDSQGQGFFSHGGDAGMPSGFTLWSHGNSLNVGVIVEPLVAQTADMLGVSTGVLIKSVAHKSAADLAGLRAHDVILQVDNEAITTTSEWERMLRSSDGKPVQVTIQRDKMRQVVTLQVDAKRHKAALERGNRAAGAPLV